MPSRTHKAETTAQADRHTCITPIAFRSMKIGLQSTRPHANLILVLTLYPNLKLTLIYFLCTTCTTDIINNIIFTLTLALILTQTLTLTLA